MTVCTYSQKYVFETLGMKGFVWETGPQMSN